MGIDYQYKPSDHREFRECDCCQAIAPVSTFEDRSFSPPRPVEFRELCDLCSTTFASTAQHYPDQHEGQVATLQAICYVGNAILDAITHRREKVKK